MRDTAAQPGWGRGIYHRELQSHLQPNHPPKTEPETLPNLSPAVAGCRVPVPLSIQHQQAAGDKSGKASKLGRDIQVGKGHPKSLPNFAAPRCSLHRQTGTRGRLALNFTPQKPTLFT